MTCPSSFLRKYASLSAVWMGLLSIGCGSGGGEGQPGNDTTRDEGQGDREGHLKHPPALNADAPLAVGQSATLVIDHVNMGDKYPNGVHSPKAWETLGFDLDGHWSTTDSAVHCQPVEGANPGTVKTDGKWGVDNSFGANVLSQLTSWDADFSNNLNKSFRQGWRAGWVIQLDAIGQEPTQRGITGAIFRAANPDGQKPLGDGRDVYDVRFESVLDGDMSRPRLTFSGAYSTDGKWVAEAKGDFEMVLSIEGFEVAFRIHRPLLVARPVWTPLGPVFDGGVIAGVVETEPFIEALRTQYWGNWDTSLCQGSTFSSFAQQIRVASDMLIDGTQDPSQECNAISIGIGFTAVPAVLGDVAAEEPPRQSACGG